VEESEVQFGTGSLSDIQLQDAKRFLAESEYNQTQALVALLQKYYQLQHDMGEPFVLAQETLKKKIDLNN
ncbi:MAG: hypothetical protein ACRDFB_10750, partial [Rhabdochlamydiaceae bacterium]